MRSLRLGMVVVGLLLVGQVSVSDAFDYMEQFQRMQQHSFSQQLLQQQSRIADQLEQSRVEQDDWRRRQLLMERERQLQYDAERRQMERHRQEREARW